MPGEAAPLDVGRLARDEGLEVHAGAEAAARAGEDADGERVVAVELVQRGGDPLRHRAVDGVAGLGTVDRDDEDRVAALGQDGGHAPQPTAGPR